MNDVLLLFGNNSPCNAFIGCILYITSTMSCSVRLYCCNKLSSVISTTVYSLCISVLALRRTSSSFNCCLWRYLLWYEQVIIVWRVASNWATRVLGSINIGTCSSDPSSQRILTSRFMTLKVIALTHHSLALFNFFENRRIKNWKKIYRSTLHRDESS